MSDQDWLGHALKIQMHQGPTFHPIPTHQILLNSPIMHTHKISMRPWSWFLSLKIVMFYLLNICDFFRGRVKDLLQASKISEPTLSFLHSDIMIIAERLIYTVIDCGLNVEKLPHYTTFHRLYILCVRSWSMKNPSQAR